jgi:hypothetical protein
MSITGGAFVKLPQLPPEGPLKKSMYGSFALQNRQVLEEGEEVYSTSLCPSLRRPRWRFCAEPYGQRHFGRVSSLRSRSQNP